MFKLISKQIMTILVSNSLLNWTYTVDRRLLLTLNLANITSVFRNKKGASSEALSLYSLKDHAQQVSFCQRCSCIGQLTKILFNLSRTPFAEES